MSGIVYDQEVVGIIVTANVRGDGFLEDVLWFFVCVQINFGADKIQPSLKHLLQSCDLLVVSFELFVEPNAFADSQTPSFCEKYY